MKKLALVLAVVMVLSLGLTACGGSTSSTGTASSAPAGSSSSGSASDAAPAYNPDALQVKALDDNTLQVTLTARTPYFLELTAFPAYAPVQQATVEANGEAWAVDAATYIGNGPYKIAEWVPSSHITMVKNENYWNVDSLAGPDTLQFTLMEDDAAQLTAFQSGELDFIDAVPNDEIDALSSTPEFYKEGQIGTYYVSYNTQAAPFDDPLVRQAFTLAVDRDYICKQIGKSGQIPAGAFVSEGLSDAAEGSSFREVGGDYYDPTAGANEANLAKAKELLAEAGYPNGEGLPTITYLYNEGTAHQQIGEALQQMWGQLGATVTLESQEWATFLNTRKNGDYQVARNGWLGDDNDPISFLDMWITGGGNNDAQWSNAEFDSLIKQIKSSGDAEARMEMMHQAEDIIFDEWMLCPIYYYVDIYMAQQNLENLSTSPLGFKFFMNASNGTDTLKVCTGPDPDTIDPALNSAVDGGTMIDHAFEGLYTVAYGTTPTPGQAESVEISEDGLTYTFHLREGLKWSDGTPLTAHDFVYSWQRAVDPATGADYAYMFECIAGYTEAINGEEYVAPAADASSASTSESAAESVSASTSESASTSAAA